MAFLMTLNHNELEYRDVGTLVPYINNARTHSETQINQIAASIKEFGFTNPVLVDGNNGIIAGHGRVMAAKKLKFKEVPVIELAYLTAAQRKAYIIADNKLALNAGWDDQLLSIELDNLKSLDFDLELIGFDLEELAALGGADFQPGTMADQGSLDVLNPITCPSCGHEFTK